ncbi:MAG: DegT/DnrJ/EryC1/StrS family aminotransferase [Planctomycetota bacterium]
MQGLAQQYRALLGELLPEIERILLEEEPILGASLEGFEQDFAAYVGAKEAVGVGSGTDALVLALRGCGIGAGHAVVTVAHTFVATITAIMMAGATPILVEPDPHTMNVAEAAIAAAITPRTRAVIAVHLYGRSAPIAAIAELCRQRNLVLLEDCAQAHGACGADGRRVGAFGHVGCFSFHPSKNLGAFGDGGIITTSDTELARRLRCLRNLGKVTKYDVAEPAPNSKLDTLQAALLRGEAAPPRPVECRSPPTRRALLASLAARRRPVLPATSPPPEHVHHQYVVRTARRDALRTHLKERGINAGIHYPIPPHLQRVGRALGFKRGDFPLSETLASTVLSLPISPELTAEQVDDVSHAIIDFFRA